MLRLFTSLLLISTTLDNYFANPVAKSSLRRSLKRSADNKEEPFDRMISVRTPIRRPAITASAGSNVMLECEAGGYPTPNTWWEKGPDNHVIPKSLLTVKQETGLSILKMRLYLDEIKPDQAGSYSCYTRNDHGRKHRDFTIKVNENGNVEWPGDEIEEYDDTENGTVGIPARITAWTSNAMVVQGRAATLYCKAEGSPKPTIAWFSPEGKQIQHSTKYRIMSDGELVIMFLAWKDMGVYVCKTENAFGNDTVSSFIYPIQPS